MPERKDPQPDPALQNEVFVKEVRRLLPGVLWTEEKPVVRERISREDVMGTFYTFRIGERKVVTEWRVKTGFCVSMSKETEYGKDPKSVIMNPYLAAKRVAELMGPNEVVGFVESNIS